MRKIEMSSYSIDWASKFEEEKDLIRGILGEEALSIFHIGSTSVKGLKAKPIIDILLVVKDLDRLDSYDDEFRKLGYEPKGEYGIEARRFYMKGGDRRTHHIHAFRYDNLNEIMRHLIFRDYLREHDDLKKEYGDLKQTLRNKYYDDIEAYSDGKDEFVKEVEKKAIIDFWASKNQ